MTQHPEIALLTDGTIDRELAPILGEPLGRAYTSDGPDSSRVEEWLRAKRCKVTWYCGVDRGGRSIFTASLRLTGPAMPPRIYGLEAIGSGFTSGRAIGEALLVVKRTVHPDLFRAFQRSKA